MKEWFYTITESMLALGLRGTELNLFAILFGYSQKGDGCCYATRAELASRCGVSSVRTIDAALDSLEQKGLIRKFNLQKEGQFLTAYAYDKKAADRGAKIAQGGVQKLHGGCANSAPKENKEVGKENRKSVSTTSPHKNACVRENPPTEKEIEDYVRGRGFADPAGFAAYYLTYQTEAGWMTGKGKARKPIDNWKLNVLAWEPNHKFTTYNSPTPTAPSPKKHLSRADQAFENMMALGRELGIIGDNKNTPDYEQQ